MRVVRPFVQPDEHATEPNPFVLGLYGPIVEPHNQLLHEASRVASVRIEAVAQTVSLEDGYPKGRFAAAKPGAQGVD